MEFSSMIFLFLFLLSANFLWTFGKRDKFLESEADRCLNNFCEVDDNWNSNGKVYTKGLAFVKDKNNNLKIIKQAKLCDIGLLK